MEEPEHGETREDDEDLRWYAQVTMIFLFFFLTLRKNEPSVCTKTRWREGTNLQPLRGVQLQPLVVVLGSHPPTRSPILSVLPCVILEPQALYDQPVLPCAALGELGNNARKEIGVTLDRRVIV